MTEIERAAEVIRNGGLVAFPTETVYGLGANAFDVTAVDRIFTAKGRPATSPLIVHVSSRQMAKSVVREWPPEADLLAHHFWPGPLTLVLPKRPEIPDRVTAALGTVGVRMPAHPVARALIEAAGVPIAAPSANRFTEISPTTAAHVQSSLGGSVDMILDGGPTNVGIESTVLALSSAGPVLLRPGMVMRSEIESIIGTIRLASEDQIQEAHQSPGMHQRHYSPRKPVLLTSVPPPDSAYVWWNLERRSMRNIRMPPEPTGYAHRLYEVLHLLDSEDVKIIAVEPVPETTEWDAIRDRLNRAQGRAD